MVSHVFPIDVPLRFWESPSLQPSPCRLMPGLPQVRRGPGAGDREGRHLCGGLR